MIQARGKAFASVDGGNRRLAEQEKSGPGLAGREEHMGNMNIKEAEEETGITRQNIRFYEKKGADSAGEE